MKCVSENDYYFLGYPDGDTNKPAMVASMTVKKLSDVLGEAPQEPKVGGMPIFSIAARETKSKVAKAPAKTSTMDDSASPDGENGEAKDGDASSNEE